MLHVKVSRQRLIEEQTDMFGALFNNLSFDNPNNHKILTIPNLGIKFLPASTINNLPDKTHIAAHNIFHQRFNNSKKCYDLTG
jgi:hypothetical protein